MTDESSTGGRLFKKPDLLTRPAPARRDAPFRVRARSEHPKMFFHTCLDTFSSHGLDESPAARIQRGSVLTRPPSRRQDAAFSQQTARCTSTGDSPGHLTTCWRGFSTAC